MTTDIGSRPAAPSVPTELVARPEVAWADECRVRRVVLSLRNKAHEYERGDKPMLAEGKREEADAVEAVLMVALAASRLSGDLGTGLAVRL